MIIFAGSVPNVDKFAESTHLLCYHYKLLDKQKQLNKFLTTAPAIITTTALANGVNLPNVRVVLHLLYATFGLLDFGQESRLLSRNHEAGRSIVCVTPAERRSFQKKAASSAGGIKEVERRAMAAYVLTAECRRTILNRHFDDMDMSCFLVQLTRCLFSSHLSCIIILDLNRFHLVKSRMAGC